MIHYLHINFADWFKLFHGFVTIRPALGKLLSAGVDVAGMCSSNFAGIAR